jgi:ABC-type multidrug transport system ATPase subunit
MNLITRIKNLVKTFKNNENKNYNAIDNLNLTVYSGQITAILGKPKHEICTSKSHLKAIFDYK